MALPPFYLPPQITKFVYLMPVTDPLGLEYTPYDLVVVDVAAIDPKDYYTLSANGVTHVMASGESEFTSLAEWVRQVRRRSCCRAHACALVCCECFFFFFFFFCCG